MYYLIAYDIANPKRLSKVAKILSDYGTRIQYSIFEAELLPSKFNELVMRICNVIDKARDGVKYFTLCESCLQSRQSFGKALPYNLDVPFLII